jgi:hypothetical protein
MRPDEAFGAERFVIGGLGIDSPVENCLTADSRWND